MSAMKSIRDTVSDAVDTITETVNNAKEAVEERLSTDEGQPGGAKPEDIPDHSLMADETAQPTADDAATIISADNPGAAGQQFAQPGIGEEADLNRLDVSTGEERREISGSGGTLKPAEEQLTEKN